MKVPTPGRQIEREAEAEAPRDWGGVIGIKWGFVCNCYKCGGLWHAAPSVERLISSQSPHCTILYITTRNAGKKQGDLWQSGLNPCYWMVDILSAPIWIIFICHNCHSLMASWLQHRSNLCPLFSLLVIFHDNVNYVATNSSSLASTY